MKRLNKIWLVGVMVVLSAYGSAWADLTDELIAHWKLDEVEGDIAYDLVGGNHGTLMNGPLWTTGLIDGALEFDGEDDYVELGTSDDLDDLPLYDMTVSAWIYDEHTGGTTWGTIAGCYANNHGWSFRMFSNASGDRSLYFQVPHSGGNYDAWATYWSVDGTIFANNWLHTAVVWDAGTKTAKLYINGEEPSYQTTTPGTGTYNSDVSRNKEIGRIPHVGGIQYFKGMIDDVRIYDRALSAEEVEQLYQDGVGELVSLEIVGPNTVAEGFRAQYKAIAHYEMTDLDVTDLADWSVEPNDIADIDDGLLETEEIDKPQNITITAKYTVDGNFVSAAKEVTIFPICPGGSALDFDGVDDRVEVTDNTTLDLPDAISVKAWILTNITSGWRTIVSKGAWHGSWNVNYHFYKDKDNYHLLFGFNDGAWHRVKSSQPITPGMWYHVAGTYDGSNLKLYINGSLDDTLTYSATMPTTASPLGIGNMYWEHYQWSTTDVWNGTIDEVAIFNRALSAEEIQATMYTRLNGDELGLVAYWDFDEGEGEIAGDSSGNGNDGTLVGAEWVQSDAPIGICTPVAVDIKPGSCPNPLNLSSQGVLPVAVLGKEDFDVTSIYLPSIRLADVAIIRHSYEDVASPVTDGNECECTEDGPDGYTDLTLKFRTQDIVEQLIYSQDELAKGQTLALTLTGELFDDIGIEGTDCVRLVGNVPKCLAARRWDANGDGVVNMADFAIFAENWLHEW